MPHGHTRHILTEPCTHARHVRSSDLPRMDRVEKLSAHVERDGMATDVPNDGAHTQSRKRHVLKGGRRRRTVSALVRNLQSKRKITS